MRAAIRNILLGTKLVIPLILDTLSAAAAYSLRLLRNAYTGFCIRVRRSSDDTLLDIGFVGGVLDVNRLLAFVGGGNGFVVTWYDQSVNARHATQATVSNQPRIVNAGVLDVQNTKACVSAIATTKWLDLPDIMTGAGAATAVVVLNNVSASGWGRVNNAVGQLATHTPYSDGNAYDGFCTATRQVFSSYGLNNALKIHTMRHTGTALQCFKNGAQVDGDKTGLTFTSNSASNRLLNGAETTVFFSDTFMCEAVFFGSALSTSDRQLLEANQKAYYGTP